MEYFYLFFLLPCQCLVIFLPQSSKVYQLMPSGQLNQSQRVIYIIMSFLGQTPSLCNPWDPGANFICAASQSTAYTISFFTLPNIFPFRWYIIIFVDSFQDCFKDGTEPGTCDCRWFASLILFYTTVHSECTVFPTSQHSVLVGMFTLYALYFPLVSILICSL